MKRKSRSRDTNWFFLKWRGHSFSNLTSTYIFLYKGVWMPERGVYVAAIHILNLHALFSVKQEDKGNHCVTLKGVIHSVIWMSEVFHCDILELVCIIKIIILWGFCELFTSNILDSRAANITDMNILYPLICFHTDLETHHFILSFSL